METKEKSLEELRAAIEEDQKEAPDPSDESVEDSEGKSEQDASTSEGTSESALEDGPSEGTDNDQWVVPGRFKTHEDVLKAYSELESFAGRQGSEIAKLRTAISEPRKSGETPEEKQLRLKRFADELSQDPEKALEHRMKKVVSEVETSIKASEFKRAYESRISDKNSDFAELEPIMTQIAVSYGDMIMSEGLQNDPRLLDILHLAARGIKAAELAKKAESKGVKKGEEIHRKKGKARVEGSSGTGKAKKIDTSRLTASEMKALIQKGDIDLSE